RNHIWVYTSRIWQALNDALPNYGQAGAYAMTLLVLTSIGVLMQTQFSKRGRSFQTVTGKGFRPHPVKLGVWRLPATIFLCAYLTRYMPYGMRYSSTSMFQIGRELEESAQMSGAGWWQTFRRIILPLLAPGLIAGWIYIVIVSFRELGASVLLYSPGKEVLSI